VLPVIFFSIAHVLGAAFSFIRCAESGRTAAAAKTYKTTNRLPA
jgi:hypothetical protein